MMLNYTNFENAPSNIVVIDTKKDTIIDYTRVITIDPNRYMRLPFAVKDLMDELLLPKDDTLVLRANDGAVFDCAHKTLPFTSPRQK